MCVCVNVCANVCVFVDGSGHNLSRDFIDRSEHPADQHRCSSVPLIGSVTVPCQQDKKTQDVRVCVCVHACVFERETGRIKTLLQDKVTGLLLHRQYFKIRS